MVPKHTETKLLYSGAYRTSRTEPTADLRSGPMLPTDLISDGFIDDEGAAEHADKLGTSVVINECVPVCV